MLIERWSIQKTPLITMLMDSLWWETAMLSLVTPCQVNNIMLSQVSNSMLSQVNNSMLSQCKMVSQFTVSIRVNHITSIKLLQISSTHRQRKWQSKFRVITAATTKRWTTGGWKVAIIQTEWDSSRKFTAFSLCNFPSLPLTSGSLQQQSKVAALPIKMAQSLAYSNPEPLLTLCSRTGEYW